ncbi:MAG: immunoglobulin domain-containing protein [Anaerohalosphaera sp.]|nr:immunoglobulin domain-containing protein [Anaerohalosphaera sp.]
MKKKKTIFIWLVMAALVVLASPTRAEVIYLDDFEAYDIENPSDFSIDGGTLTGNWTASNTAANATRTYHTGNYGGSDLWISITDGTAITSAGITISSDTYYTFTANLVAETYKSTSAVECTYDLLVGQDAGTATSIIGGPATAIAHGDTWVLDDSYDDQITTQEFATGTLNAGDKLFIKITRVGTAAGFGAAWFGVDNVAIDEGSSTMAPTLDSPENTLDVLVGIGDSLIWNAPLSGTPDSYNLIYKDDPNILDNPTVITGLTELSDAPGLAYDTTYSWAVEAVHGTTAYRSVVWTFQTAPETPVIEIQPESITVGLGDPSTLTVEHLNGTNFQWYQDGTPVGANDPTLTIASTQTTDEGTYYCVVSNAAGSDISDNAVVMTRRLVAHWDFEDGSLVDEVDLWTGTFTDPNTDNDAPDPTDRFIAGYAGDGFDFAGDTLHIEVAETEGLFNFFTNGLTVSCWVKAGTESTGSYSAMVAKHTYSDPRAGFLATQQNSNGRPRFVIDGWGGMSSVASANVQDGSWHHVVMTYEPGYNPEDPDRKQGRVYINGGGVTYDEEGATSWLRTTGSGTGTPALRWDVPLRIGCDNETGAGSLDGTVDEVKIWSYALTPTEVAQEYTSYETEAQICTDEVLFDYNNDCEVGIADFAIFAAEWLNSNMVSGS